MMSPDEEREIKLLERRLRCLLFRYPTYKLNTAPIFVRDINNYRDVKDIPSLIQQLSTIESENTTYEN